MDYHSSYINVLQSTEELYTCTILETQVVMNMKWSLDIYFQSFNNVHTRTIVRIFVRVYRPEFNYFLIHFIQFFHINRWPSSQSCIVRLCFIIIIWKSNVCNTEVIISHRARPKTNMSASSVIIPPFSSKASLGFQGSGQYNRPQGPSESYFHPMVERFPHYRF